VHVTSIVAWAGVDSRAVSSIYLASDSRITWPGGQVWDRGRKTFAALNRPNIFAYWGDVLFPALAIPVVMQQLEAGMIHTKFARPHGATAKAIRRLWIDYPHKERRNMGILMASRAGEGWGSTFSLSTLTFDARTSEWKLTPITMPSGSARLRIAGSGTKQIEKASLLWAASPERRTSRAVFGAFCDALHAGGDDKSGGPPQLVGLHRAGPAKTFGIVYQRNRYLAGAKIQKGDASNEIEWFNELFERVDGRTKLLLPGAKRHRRAAAS
jgi:hypothetical protein